MLEQNLFYRFRQLIGGFRHDAPPVVADGAPATARFDALSDLYVIVGAIAPGVHFQVEGIEADGTTPPTANPVQVGAVSDAVLTAVADNVVVHFVTDTFRRLRTLPEGATADGVADGGLNPLKLGAVVDAVLTALADGQTAQLITDTFRRLYTNPQGGVADGAADDSTNPVKVGGVAIQVPTAVDNGDRAQFTTDLERFLRIVSKAYDTIASADRASVNTIADDRDEAAQIWAAETNTAGPVTSYYPSTAGAEIGNRDHLTLVLVMTDNTTTIEASNDGTTWIDITMSVLDLNTGAFFNPNFPTGAGLSKNFILDIERVNARYVRCAVAYPDAGNATSIKVMARKA